MVVTHGYAGWNSQIQESTERSTNIISVFFKYYLSICNWLELLFKTHDNGWIEAYYMMYKSAGLSLSAGWNDRGRIDRLCIR